MLIVIFIAMFFLNRGFFSVANLISMFTYYSYFIIRDKGL